MHRLERDIDTFPPRLGRALKQIETEDLKGIFLFIKRSLLLRLYDLHRSSAVISSTLCHRS